MLKIRSKSEWQIAFLNLDLGVGWFGSSLVVLNIK